jgi:ribonuclease PH
MRNDGRKNNQLRAVDFILDFIQYPEGSVLIKQGNTHVLCNVTLENSVPRWMQLQNISGGWVTAEYAMLPRATHLRTPRETNGLSGRTQEIKRLIGRSLRAGVDLPLLGPRTCIVDCDVLMADGGTRTAAITGAYVALELALRKLISDQLVPPETIRAQVAATSVGLIQGDPVLDLCYLEDSQAEVDLNVVMTSDGNFVEIQGTAETKPFSRHQLDQLLDLAESGIRKLHAIQRQALANRRVI